MTHYGELGKRDGSYVRWETNNPREVVWKLKEDNPGKDDDDLMEMFREAMQTTDNREYLLTVIDYYFLNACRSWRRATGEPDQKVVSIRATKQRVAAVKEQIMDNAKSIVLMDLLLPHGKTLCDSTGGECQMLAPRMGAWLGKIAKAVPTGKLVGKTLTEAKVREFYASV